MRQSEYRINDKHKKSIQNNFFFQDMADNEIAKFFKQYKWQLKSYEKDEVDFDEKIFLENLNIILEGFVKIVKLTENGKEIIYSIVEPGSCFGFASIYTDLKMEGLQTEAMQKSLILSIESSEFRKIISEREDFFLKFMQFQEYRFHFFVRRFENSCITCPYEKLIYYIDFMKKWNVNKITMPKTHLANYLNIGRASLYRELNKLKDEGLIETIDDIIHIK